MAEWSIPCDCCNLKWRQSFYGPQYVIRVKFLCGDYFYLCKDCRDYGDKRCPKDPWATIKCECCLERGNVSEETMLCGSCTNFSNCHSSVPGQVLPDKCQCCQLKRPLALVTYACRVHQYYICVLCHWEHTICPHKCVARETLDSEKSFENLEDMYTDFTKMIFLCDVCNHRKYCILMKGYHRLVNGFHC